MENNSLTPQQNPIAKIAKNPWWVKVTPHAIIICIFLKAVSQGFGPGKTLEVLVWIWLGSLIMRDKFVPISTSRLLLLSLVALNIWETYPTIILLSQWVMRMLHAQG